MNAIAMDISRLIGRSHYSTPTGIDRFELQYALWARARSSFFVEMGRNKPIAIDEGRATGLITDLSKRWSGTALSPKQSMELEQIYAAIDGKISWCDLKRASAPAQPTKIKQWSLAAGKSLRAWLPAGPVERNAPFVHVSHTNLDRPAAFSWLDSRRRSGVFYVHDLIPVTHPEFVRKREPQRHLQRMETVLRHAGLVLCNSQTTARSLRSFAEDRGREAPPIAILPPGIESSFRQTNRSGVTRTKNPYFVIVGTIEPRKNHILLLQLWRWLVERDGDSAPRLVIAGKRGWENAQVFATLDRCPQLRDMVIEVSDLGDAALADLLSGAAALLAPSFVEGYGMPVAEAMATGTPVIASDIPSHKEIIGDQATLLDPCDGLGWRAAIDAHTSEYRSKSQHASQDWNGHFQVLDELLENAVQTVR
ncbi:glycosyltransferase family 4 protein (plasmid) [Phyllobacterium sp. 628]|uniref:glycosyltransferase family 4 protein n=1 Tax=Phyllobacterium sp. 628 TaxID=2718938 RepID=UPI0016623FCD|nr:glycosyltransferase family 1 protein [Phyllobacterium sp. 628]QND50586.1 glycosyltransferase family 4 protein [Phyllobacterium sp. 628]